VVATFSRILKVPSVLMGIGLHDDNLHAPNEKIDLDNFYTGNQAAVYLMDELGAAAGRQARRQTPMRPRQTSHEPGS
jgi:acetylornithine deacetylase/succinyl-diaminopimelate desuccinylase-like protein